MGTLDYRCGRVGFHSLAERPTPNSTGEPLELLKYARSPELRGRLPGVARLLSEVLDEPDGGACVMAMLRYLATVSDQVKPEELLRVIESHMSPQGRKLMPTIAEQWVEQGIEKGIERGELQGQIRLLEELLGKPLSDREELRQLTLEQLAERFQSLRDEQKA